MVPPALPGMSKPLCSKTTFIETITETQDEKSASEFIKLEDLDGEDLHNLLGDLSHHEFIDIKQEDVHLSDEEASCDLDLLEQ